MKEEMIQLPFCPIVDRGGGECGGGCEDKSVCAWEDKILSAFMLSHSRTTAKPQPSRSRAAAEPSRSQVAPFIAETTNEDLETLAKDMIWACITGKVYRSQVDEHPVDGGAWKKFDMQYPDFGKRTKKCSIRFVKTTSRKHSPCPESRDEVATTQNSGICELALTGKCLMVSFKKSSSLIIVFHVGCSELSGSTLATIVESRNLLRNGMTQIIGSEISESERPHQMDDDGVEMFFLVKKKDTLCLRPIEIGFEDRADNTVVPTGPYSTQWGNYFGEMIRSIPLYHPSWQKVPAGDKARLMATLGLRITRAAYEIERSARIEGKKMTWQPRGTSESHVLSSPHVNGVFLDPELSECRLDEGSSRRRVRTPCKKSTRWSEAESFAALAGVGPVMPGYVRSRLSYTAPVDRSRDVDFMMNLMRSDNRFADAFARYDSGGASGSRARDREDGDDTGGEDGGDDTS
ncbi:hypothetical protein Tco_0798416 [Tanacetum coccineum]